MSEQNAKERVLELHPQAWSKTRDAADVSAVERLSGKIRQEWIIVPVPIDALGVQNLGVGQTEDQAWDDAARNLNKEGEGNRE